MQQTATVETCQAGGEKFLHLCFKKEYEKQEHETVSTIKS